MGELGTDSDTNLKAVCIGFTSYLRPHVALLNLGYTQQGNQEATSESALLTLFGDLSVIQPKNLVVASVAVNKNWQIRVQQNQEPGEAVMALQLCQAYLK